MEHVHPGTETPIQTDSAAAELLPLSIGDVFDEAFDLYKRNFALFAGIVAVVSVPAQILFQVVNVALGMDRLASKLGDGGDSADPSAAMSLVFGLMAVWFVQMVAFTFAHVIQSGALTVAVSERYLGRHVSLGCAYRSAWRRVWALLLTWVLVLLITGAAASGILFVVGLLAAVVAGVLSMAGSVGAVAGIAIVIVAIVFGCLVAAGVFVVFGIFVTQIVTIEGIGYGAALDRNRGLIRGRAPRIAVAVILLWIVQLCLWGALWGSIQLILQLLVFPVLRVPEMAQNLTGTSISAVLWMLLEPFWLVSVTLLYYDQRVRREGFDLTVLDKQVQAISAVGKKR